MRRWQNRFIPWWMRIVLWFRPYHVTNDFGSGDKCVILWYKKHRGKIYVMRQEVCE